MGTVLTSTPIGLCGYWLWAPQFPLNTGISLPGKDSDDGDDDITYQVLDIHPTRFHTIPIFQMKELKARELNN